MNKYFTAITIFTLAFIVERIVRNRKAGMAALATWVVPGLGQFLLGHRFRGLLFGSTVVALFLAGLALTDACGVAPFGRHDIWAIAQGFAGALFWVAAFVTKGFLQERDLPLYQIGCLYAASAGLLNLLLILDAYDIGVMQTAEKKETPAEGNPA